MADFGIRFFLCNILLCAIIAMLLMIKRALRNHLTSRMQFHLWFLLSGLLAIPFLPVRPVRFSQILLWIDKLKHAPSPHMDPLAKTEIRMNASAAAGQIDDFVLSVSSKTPSMIGLTLSGIWLIGVFAMLLLVIKAGLRLNAVKKSALPLQSRDVRVLYHHCLKELKIKKNIPVYSTAFLKSPIIAGLFRPCIYVPIHLISDFNAADMRYMLLHELQHYRHRDAIAGCLMNLSCVLYWFNPFVWYAIREMRDDREVACDISVLDLLNENDYADYGNTLINFAETVSLTPFPFVSGISGTMKQLQKRIVHISSYKKPSVWKKIKGTGIFALIALILFAITPLLSTHAAEQSYYKWNISPEKIRLTDLSDYFRGYEGTFTLYDLEDDAWVIYNMDHATLRTAPDSTYKIYSALFGLEEGVITTEDSFMAWNGTRYPFDTWNSDQDLHSAMQSSVNWYFQETDRQLGATALRKYLKKTGYGNEHTGSDLSSFWMQSVLKISPVEQVELLTNLYRNHFGFIPENIAAVKDSIRLFSSEAGNFYGKTGTGQINKKDISGWFIGYIETADRTCFFATNIRAAEHATGSKASEISLSILSDMGIWTTAR